MNVNLHLVIAVLLGLFGVAWAADEPCECDCAPPTYPGYLGDYLRDKAAAYEFDMPRFTEGYGGMYLRQYTDATHTRLFRIRDVGDSTFYTGLYAVSQAMRWKVTREPQALAEVKRMARTLHRHLKVTRTPGYIARYVGPDRFPFNTDCPIDANFDLNCGIGQFRRGTGPFAGDYWRANTSRDQYIGWWMANWQMYEVLAEAGVLGDGEAEALARQIQRDVREVIDTVAANGYVIVAEDGLLSPSAPFVLASIKYSWHLIAARVLDTPYYHRRADEVWWELRAAIPLEFAASFTASSGSGYYGYNLNYMNAYSMFMLAPRERFEELFAVWDDTMRSYTRNTWNAWFDGIFMAAFQRSRRYDAGRAARVVGEIERSLAWFQGPPNTDKKICPFEQDEDPFATTDNTRLAQNPYCIPCRCREEFLWQRDPRKMDCGGDHPEEVFPGMDYLVAYWLARYHELLPGPSGQVLAGFQVLPHEQGRRVVARALVVGDDAPVQSFELTAGGEGSGLELRRSGEPASIGDRQATAFTWSIDVPAGLSLSPTVLGLDTHFTGGELLRDGWPWLVVE